MMYREEESIHKEASFNVDTDEDSSLMWYV